MKGVRILRTLKEPEERRNEILDTAERLFFTKGYSKTTIIDILNEIGIAKGTFYYYYKSKEEVMDAIIIRTLTYRIERAKQIMDNKNLGVIDKLFFILLDQKSDEKEKYEAALVEQFHQPENAQIHQKSMKQVILLMAPVLTKVVKQGIEEKIFSTKYPLESIEILLSSSSILFDEGIFHWSKEERLQKARAFIDTTEKVLGAKKGCFDKFLQIISG